MQDDAKTSTRGKVVVETVPRVRHVHFDTQMCFYKKNIETSTKIDQRTVNLSQNLKYEHNQPYQE